MRILAFSDLHCDRAAAERLVAAGADADLVVGAGDFASAHQGLAETMALLRPLEDKALYVPGNNETPDALRATTRARVLHGDSVEVAGMTIAGIGGAVPPLPPLPWKSYDLTEAEAELLLAPVTRADLLICHSPPEGVADRLEDGRGIGSTALRAAIARLRPRLAVCGHIHACWGEEGRIADTRVVNLGPGLTWFDL